jgi:hypothetical protein
VFGGDNDLSDNGQQASAGSRSRRQGPPQPATGFAVTSDSCAGWAPVSGNGDCCAGSPRPNWDRSATCTGRSSGPSSAGNATFRSSICVDRAVFAGAAVGTRRRCCVARIRARFPVRKRGAADASARYSLRLTSADALSSESARTWTSPTTSRSASIPAPG